jgi:hypothetical protein
MRAELDHKDHFAMRWAAGEARGEEQTYEITFQIKNVF